MMALGWQDKRMILMLSTYHNADTELHSRYTMDRREEIQKPVVVCDYTSHMGAVDRADHYCASYSFTRKTLRWWRKLFFWLVELSIVNSFLLFKQIHNTPAARHLQFRDQLILQLVGEVRNTSRRNTSGRTSTSDDSDRLKKITHFIAKAARGHTKICLVCSKRVDKKCTVYYCKTCERKPGLHPGECFERYHTLKNYKL
uniref:Intraflagellar transport protein 140 homolog n=1 Tax=Phallusia mammillata TaxID=59560 RepID=A0A6F9DFQ7_9ASCI|nr:intraflagellar transport protein 140 homolog [Phallusia mammillata]